MVTSDINITKHKIIKQLVSIAIPSVITNLTVPLTSLVDTTIAGHMGQTAPLAAIAVGGAVFNLLYWIFSFLRFSTGGLAAQAFGRKDLSAIIYLLFRGILIAIFFGSLLIAVSPIYTNPLVDFIGADDNIRSICSEYIYYGIWGAPAVLCNYVFTGWFIGQQQAAKPMTTAFVINGVNILASILLVFVFHSGIEGLALGTVFGQWAGTILYLLFASRTLRHSNPVHFSLKYLLNDIFAFIRINTDLLLRTICLIGVSVWFTRTGATIGTDYLAANVLLMQFFTIFSYLYDGVAAAGEAVCGMYKSSQNNLALRTTIGILLRSGLFISLIFTVLYALVGPLLLSLLSSDHNISLLASNFIPWVASIPLCGYLAFTWDGILTGTTDTRAMLTSLVLGTVLFFLMIAAFKAVDIISDHLLWLAFISYLAGRSIYLALYGRRKYLHSSYVSER